MQNILLQIDILQIAWFHADRKDDNEENKSFIKVLYIMDDVYDDHDNDDPLAIEGC